MKIEFWLCIIIIAVGLVYSSIRNRKKGNSGWEEIELESVIFRSLAIALADAIYTVLFNRFPYTSTADFWLTLLLRYIICALLFFMSFGTYNWIASLVRERRASSENQESGR